MHHGSRVYGRPENIFRVSVKSVLSGEAKAKGSKSRVSFMLGGGEIHENENSGLQVREHPGGRIPEL